MGLGTSYTSPLQIGFNSRETITSANKYVSCSMYITYIYLSYSSINPSHKKKIHAMFPLFSYWVIQFSVFFNFSFLFSFLSFFLFFFLSLPFSFFHSIFHPSPPSFFLSLLCSFFHLSFILSVKVIYPIFPPPSLNLSTLWQKCFSHFHSTKYSTDNTVWT